MQIKQLLYNNTMRNTATINVPSEKLPLWMQQSRTRVDWGVLLVLGFCLLVAWPFIFQPGLPRTNASENYVFLTDDYAQAFQEGRIYPRWSAHALEGYGAPIPHFYPPAAPYTASIVDVLFTNNPVDAVRLLYIGAICLAGCTIYALILRQRSATHAILGSLLYITSPYLGIVAPHIQGDLAGILSMALLPAVLWGVHRLLYASGSFDILIVIGASALLLLNDPTFWGLAILLALLPTMFYARTTSGQRGRILRLWLTLGLSPGLAAFFWMPALLDQSTVQWIEQTIAPREMMLTLSGLITPFQRIDLIELNPIPQFTLGLPLVMALIMGAASLLLFRRLWSLEALYLSSGLTLAVIAILMLPTETWLLGPITFCLAVGGSAAADLLPAEKQWRYLALPVTTGVILALSIPVFLAPRWPSNFGDVTPQSRLEYEQRGWGVASLPPQAAIPATVQLPLASQRFLNSEYRSEAGIINRITPDQITASTQVSTLDSATHIDRFQINVTTQSILRLLRSYFPGWEATLDGELLRVNPEPDTGLLRINVPENSTGQLTVELKSTQERQRAWLVTTLVSAVVALITFRRLRNNPTPTHHFHALISANDARLLTIILIAGGIMLALFIIPDAPFSLHARPGHAIDNTFAVERFTETGLYPLSYDIDDTRYRQGETIRVTLAWRAQRPINFNYQVYIHLRDTEQNVRWQQGEPQHPGGYPTTRWTVGDYVRDIHTLRVPSSTPPGEYEIAIEVGICEPECLDMRRLSFYDPATDTSNNILPLTPTLTITR